MNTSIVRTIVVAAIVVTLTAFAVWIGTGSHWYTKYEVVKIVEKKPAEDDIFADTGLYDEDEPVTETIRTDEFHLGLLPTPQGIFDKHLLSVGTLVVPAWAIAGIVLLMQWRRARKKS